MLSGKTTLVLNFIKEIIESEDMHLLFFDFDIRKEKVLQNINNDFIKTNLYINNTHSISVREILEQTKEINSKRKLDLLIIDDLRFIQADKSMLLSRKEEENYILKQLNLLSKELNITIIITSIARGKDLTIMSLNEKYNMNIEDYTYSINGKEITFEEFLNEYKKLFKTEVAFERAKERLKDKLNETEFANWNIIGKKDKKLLKVTRKKI